MIDRNIVNDLENIDATKNDFVQVDKEKIIAVAKSILEKYQKAFEELAK